MKGKLIALSLIAASGLMADYDSQQNKNAQRNMEPRRDQAQYQDPCNPCEPCCVPQPRKCIDAEAYNPSYYMLQCDWGAFISVDFLYWFARENNIPFALSYVNTPVVPGTPADLAFLPSFANEMNTKWAPAFRVGLGWNTGCDGWDTYLNYTWYRSTKYTTATASGPFAGITGTSDFPVSGGTGLINPFIDAGLSGIATTGLLGDTTITFDNVTGSYKLRFQQLDLELGRKFWTSRHFTIRPFAAIRGAWTRSQFSTNSSFDVGSGTTAISRSYYDSYKDRYWGVGIVGGLQPSWYFGCDNNFSVYANADIALIYGKYKSDKKESYSQTVGTAAGTAGILPISVYNTFPNHNFQMVPMMDLALGFSWEDYWCCDRYRSELDIGWEHHVLLGLTHRVITLSTKAVAATQSTFTTYNAINSDTTLGGLVVRVRFDF